mgnify:CR=1 FL=1
MIVAFFVVMGLFYMFFFLMTIVQRIVQRHVRLLHMRAESKVYRVLDLADRPLQRGQRAVHLAAIDPQVRFGQGDLDRLRGGCGPGF